ncbi:MAG: hypothetical protein M3N50_00700 [Pseudomonadota bacterium]|nr:hypothetical protein [Pseudomonadota bacterium]
MIEPTSGSLSHDEPTRLRAGPATSWGAIFAGAAVAVSVSLILLTLGAGLGFTAVSPWPNRGASAAEFTVAGTIWLIVTQWLAAGAGGYLAGRMRQRWLATHTHEVFFRDTAHGLVTWSVATLFVAAVVMGSASAVVRGGAMAAAGGPGGEILGDVAREPMMRSEGRRGGSDSAHDIDKLFRNSAPVGGEMGLRDAKMEVTHIAASAAMSGSVSAEDRAYLVTLVASRTGITTNEAQTRVSAFVEDIQEAAAKAKAAADEARKGAATAALFAALALLIGAFIASVAAAIGGRLRDEHL